jgi:hypothetical protein
LLIAGEAKQSPSVLASAREIAASPSAPRNDDLKGKMP